jgi:exosortase A
VAIALCFIFSREAQGAFRVWLESTAYNHCFLILPVALYLAWQKREVLQRLTPQPDARALALLLPLGLLWLVAVLMSVLELQQLIAVSMFQVIVLATLGWRAYRVLLLPFLYLFFLVPTGYFLMPWLQDITAWFTVAGLKLVGIPVFSDGMLIDVPAGSFVIAEACAGLRFLIASVAFGVLFAALMYRSRVRWIAFVALSVIVPILANGVRAFGIIALAEWTGSAAAIEADHIIYGWVFFTFVTLLLIAIGMRFADDRKPIAETAPASPATDPPHPRRVAVAALLGLAVAAGGPAYAQILDWHSGPASLAEAQSPPIAPPWKQVRLGESGWRPVTHQDDREFLSTFQDGNRIVTAYVALYQATGFHNNLVRGLNELGDPDRWRRGRTGQAHALIDGQDAIVAETELVGGGRKLLAWSFYLVDGTIAANPLRAKLAQLRGLFRIDHGVEAFVAVAADEDGMEPPTQTLQRFVTAMGPLREYLVKLDSQ